MIFVSMSNRTNQFIVVSVEMCQTRACQTSKRFPWIADSPLFIMSAVLTHDDVERLLEVKNDGRFGLLSVLWAMPCRRRMVALLLASSWLIGFPSFIEVFIAQEPDFETGICRCDTETLSGETGSGDAIVVSSCDAPCPGKLTCDDPTSIAADFDLYCSRKVLRSLIPTFYFIGVAFGATYAGRVADRFGRRSTFIWMWAGFVLSYPLSALSPDYPVRYCPESKQTEGRRSVPFAP